MASILIIEDDFDLAHITELYLNNAGFTTEIAYRGDDALKKVRDSSFDLILIDVALPDIQGYDLCTKIREVGLFPVIFISCIDDSETKILALKSGGDDYIVKPINYGELIARIQSNLRRVEVYQKEQDKLKRKMTNIRTYKQFELDMARRKVIHIGGTPEVDGIEINLSPTEFSLLAYLAEKQDELILYNDLYKQIWESDSLGDVRTVMVHISNLRKKVDLNHTGMIETVRGAGYIFSDV